MNDALKMMYEELDALLKEAKSLDATSEEYDKIIGQANSIADRIIKLETIRSSKSIAEMNEEGEMAKLENNLAVEEVKQRVSGGKIALELTKTLVPVIIDGAIFVWGIVQTGHFEETGRFTSALSRIIHSRFPRL